MDVYTQQLMALSAKIDTLYQLVDEIHTQISDASQESSPSQGEEVAPPVAPSRLRPSVYHSMYASYPLELEHRDVLVDNDYVQVDNQSNEASSMTTEVQIQRLTAQLTAAYNRIAALEEQLLARRVHTH